MYFCRKPITKKMSIAAYTKTCASHTPGNQQLILIATADVESITMLDGEVTVITQGTASDAVLVPIDRDGMARMEEQTATKGGLLYVVQKLEIELSKSSKSLQEFIKSVGDESACGILAVVTDNNGESWVLGAQADGTFATATAATFNKGLYMESANFTSGKALDEDDGDKFTLTLTGMFPHGAIHVKEGQEIDVTEVNLIDNPA
jgi:hypothetical protein